MATGVIAARSSPFAVFRRRNFTLLWIAQFISTMGSGLTAIAASILVFRVTGSALSVGLMMLVASLPSLLIGLIARAVIWSLGAVHSADPGRAARGQARKQPRGCGA